MVYKNLHFGFLILMLVTSINYSYSQCSVTAHAESETITCGECTSLSAFGNAGTFVLNNNFNDGTPGSGWDATVAATFTNPCGPGPTPGDAIHMWMGDATPEPRTLTSVAFDLTLGGSICFDMRYATQGDASPCEGVDLPDEGVHLQYSIDGGTTWIDIHYFDPNGGYDPTMTSWNNYCFQIPIAAQTTNTMIRWWQNSTSGNEYDHWGIDNVQIGLNDPSYYYVWTHDGYQGQQNPTPVCPTTATTYTVLLTNGTTDTCSGNVGVNVVNPDINVSAESDTTICNGDCIDINGQAEVIVSPASQPEFCNNSGDMLVLGGVEIPINVAGLNMTNITSGSILSVCFSLMMTMGDISTLTIKLICPSGTEITLIPEGVTSGQIYGGMFLSFTCFTVDAITPVSSGVSPYMGNYLPAAGVSLDDMAGCLANGIWKMRVENSNMLSMGTFFGWCIQFDDPAISYTGAFTWSPTTDMTGSNTLTPNVCPTVTTTYTLSVQDSNNCTTVYDDVVITVEDCNCTTVIDSVVTVDPSCGANNGEIIIYASGGMPPLQYSIDNGATFQSGNTFIGLGGGNYDIVVRDASPCDKHSQATLTDLPGPIIDDGSVIITGADCGISNGSITGITVSGGTTSYTYEWTDASGTPIGANIDLDNIPAGSYTFIVTDVYGCADTSAYIVNNIGGQTIDDSNIIITDANCGHSDGSITGITVSGGTPSYTYVWKDANNTTVGTNLDLTSVPAGSYTLTVTDSNACIAISGPYTVNDIPGQTIDDNSMNITIANCNESDGSITGITVSGGTPSYIYVWKDANNTTVGTNLDLTDVPAGSYTLTVTDINTCVANSGPYTISQDCKVDCLIDVPTGFSPNGDGRNDILYVKTFGIKEMEIIIFNRQGEIIFQTSDMSNGWDGTYKGIIQETAVYVYYLTGTCLNGEKIEKKGNITLLN